MVLRIDDLDPDRSKKEYIDQAFRDLEWFGLTWEGEVVYQSKRKEAYAEAFEVLAKNDLIYPCFCTRADLHSANAPHAGEEFVYQGTCHELSQDEIYEKSLHTNPAFRITVPAEVYAFEDIFQGVYQQDLRHSCGDFVVKRKDATFAYQLAVVVDDHYQGVTSVIRGYDLLSSTPRQLYLYDLFEYSCPSFGHVPLLLDESGIRLAKRNKDISLATLQEKGITAEEILGFLAFTSGLIPACEPVGIEDLVASADLSALKNRTQLYIQTMQQENTMAKQ